MKRLLVLISSVALLSLGFTTPALAAAPSNDTYAGRMAIDSLPFSTSLDTTDATTDADDAEANAECGAPFTDASVWFEMTAATDGAVFVDVSASNYSAGVIVVSGNPGAFAVESCGPEATVFYAVSGETYAILAFDDQEDSSGIGGDLQISVEAAPPPPTVVLTVDPNGRFDKGTGSATISGTISCSGDAFFAEVDVELTQNVGRFTITGYGYVYVDGSVCDGTAQPWSVEVLGSTGKFKGGKAAATASAYVCGNFDCAFDYAERMVRLR